MIIRVNDENKIMICDQADLIEADISKAINEAVEAYSGKFGGLDISIKLDGNAGGTNYEYDPYFKIYNNKDVSKASKVARVFIDAKPDIYYNPRYTHHANGRIKRPLWELTSDEKKELDSLCRSVTIGWDGHRRTVWGEILHGLERILGRSPIYYKQPDYSKLVYMSTSSGRKNQKDPNIRVY